MGIPQGSVLSSLLCSFFYGDLERRFGSYTDSPDSVSVFMCIDILLNWVRLTSPLLPPDTVQSYWWLSPCDDESSQGEVISWYDESRFFFPPVLFFMAVLGLLDVVVLCIGHPEYGCFISKDKTMTNFDYDHQIMNVVDQRARRV